MNMGSQKQLQEALCNRFELIEELTNADSHLIHRGRFLTADFVVHIGDVPYLISIGDGRVLFVGRKFPIFQGRKFTLKGSLNAWSMFWELIPKAGWHDIFALTKSGEMTLEGEMQPFFAHLQYLKDVLSKPRGVGNK